MKNRKSSRFSEINIVPYIDVMLVLLVIFMATAPLLTQGVKVDLPKTTAKAMTDKSTQLPIIITIDSNANYYLNLTEQPRKALAKEELLLKVAALRKLSPERQVLLQGDRGVDYGKVVGLMGALQMAGVEKVGLITEPVAQAAG